MTNLSVDQALLRAKSHIKRNEIEEAKKLYQSVLLTFPKNIRIQKELASLDNHTQDNVIQTPTSETINHLVNLYNEGQFAIVVEQAQSLTKQYPQAFVIWNILGAAYKGLGQVEEASEAFKKVTELNPNYANGFNNLGITLQMLGKYEEAIKAYKNALLLKPNYAEGYVNLGAAFEGQGKLNKAIASYKRAISNKPEYAEAYYNLGLTLKEQGKLDEAIESYDRALSLKPDYFEAYNNKGNALKDQGKLEEAITTYKKAIKIKPDLRLMRILIRAISLHGQGKLDEAIESYDRALSLKPDYFEAYNNKANALKDQGELEEAITTYKKAISLKPDYADAHVNLSFVLLSHGKLKEGLDEYEWRWKTNKFLSQQRHFTQPLWDGKQSLKDKKILLWSEQGIGDTINWSSLIPFVSSQAKSCILECQEKLVPLLKRSFPSIEVKPENRHLDLERDDFDFHLPMGSLYRCFLQDILKIQKPKTFLFPDPVRVKYWKERLKSLGKGPFIGISWKSSDMSTIRIPNYSSISEWSSILKIPNVIFINLQSKDFEDDLKEIEDEFGVKVHNFDDLDQFNNIDDVAALCRALDMVVSNKTTTPLISAGVGTLTKLANWQSLGTIFYLIHQAVSRYF